MSFQRIPEMVSIVVTAHNTAKYIGECLNSLINQSYTNIEIIIIDDASTDGTAHAVESWKKSLHSVLILKNIQVLLIKLPRNVGFSGAMTTGLYLTKGEFIAIQDSDDLSHHERIKKQVEYLRAHPQVDLVGTNYVAFIDVFLNEPIKQSWICYGENIKKTYEAGNHCVCHGTILFRGTAFDKMGGLTRRLPGAEDYEFIVKFLQNHLKIDNIQDELYYYRMHSSQRSKQFY